MLQQMLLQCRTDCPTVCCVTSGGEEKLTAAVVQRLEHGEGVVPPPLDFAPTRHDGRLGAYVENSLDPVAFRTTLKVPPEFDAVTVSIRGIPGQQANLQALILGFTRALLRGVSLNVLLDDGRTLLTGAALDSDLTHLVLHVPNMQHPVALSNIADLCSPSVVYQARCTTVILPVPDNSCITLVMHGGEFLTLLFEDVRLREYFEFCFKVVILAGSQRPELGTPDAPDPPTAKEDHSYWRGFVEKV